ncbi:nucleotidyltransferase family protein [Pseudomonas sp. M47T1]|uniref:nucleotidyltransferase family protein n=1 Tax=Pseudomonas sp. M47T1 TaxID=1179778 RepID=UPI0003147DF1|nr:nucleotidyltransferase family protein [Pseudomonas sp. M47T1]
MPITVIILAAGRGERYLASGGNTHKLDALLGGTPVLQRVLDAVADTGLAVHVVRPQHDNGGMGDSIARGVKATPEADGWLILPGDLALVTADSIRRVAAALRPDTVIVPQYQTRRGHPVGFPAQCFQALAALTGDSGAAAIVRRYREAGKVVDLSVYDVGITLDVDTLDDLKTAEASLATRTL